MVTRSAARRALSPKGPKSLFSFQNKGLLDPSNDDDTRSDTSMDPKTTDSRIADASMDPEPIDPRVPPPDARESVPKGSPNRGPPRGDTLVVELRNA